jgi:hypothetical protein
MTAFTAIAFRIRRQILAMVAAILVFHFFPGRTHARLVRAFD